MQGSGSETAPPPFPHFNKLDTVQDVLDRNKSLLQQIKDNHASQAPEDLSKNCVLIKELNGNIAQVVRLYKEISDSYVRYMGLSLSELSAPSPDKQQQQTGPAAAAIAAAAPAGSPEPAAPPPSDTPTPGETALNND